MYYLVIDVETTCCAHNSFPRSEMEIIEIGAVLCDRHFQPLNFFQSFVRPVVHPSLTDFCRELTSIRQKDVPSLSIRAIMCLSSQWWCPGPDDASLVETNVHTCMHVVTQSWDTPSH